MRLTARRFRMWLALAFILLTGCARAIPTYQWSSDEAAFTELARRTAMVETVEASCTIALCDESGKQIMLEGALVALHPDHLRIRAWKLHRPAFDLTATPDGVWIDAPSADYDFAQSSLGQHITKAWSMFSGGFLQRQLMIDPTRSAAGSVALREMSPALEGEMIVCTIDRRTLTPRRYEVIGLDGAVRYSIRLENHRQFGEIVWPRKIVFESGHKRLTIDVDDVEFNGEPVPQAFTPPSRAVRLP
jgi:outer membrane lipoprotein-sorting protein